jgi:hypothetical protein
MTYGVLYIDEGNFVNWYERREDAERAVLQVAEQDPAEAAKFGYFAYDETGLPVGQFVSAADLLAKREQDTAA